MDSLLLYKFVYCSFHMEIRKKRTLCITSLSVLVEYRYCILKIIKSSKGTELITDGNILNDEPISDIESDLFGYKDIAWYLREDLE